MWNIVPGIGIGPIRLRMKEDEYIDLLGDSYDVFKRGGVGDDILAYDGVGAHLTVDSEKRIVCIAVFPPNEVFWKDIQLLGRDFKVVTGELRTRGLKIQPTDVGIWIEELKVDLIEVEDKVDGIEMGVVS